MRIKQVVGVSALCALTCFHLSGCGGPPAANGSVDKTILPTSSKPANTRLLQEPALPLSFRDDESLLYEGLSSADTEARMDAMGRLLDLPNQSAVAVARQLVWDDDLEVREAALEAMIELEAYAATDVLALLITDADADMRETVVDALTEMGGPIAISLLNDATYDPHPGVRQAAYEGLEEIGGDFVQDLPMIYFKLNP
jgi:HEAT repeat protein